MFDFFNEFFNSELVKKNYLITIIGLIAFFMVLGGVVVWLYHRFFKNKRIQNELNEIKKQLKDYKKENNELKNKNILLTNKLKEYKIFEALDSSEDEDTIDKAIQTFVK